MGTLVRIITDGPSFLVNRCDKIGLLHVHGVYDGMRGNMGAAALAPSRFLSFFWISWSSLLQLELKFPLKRMNSIIMG